MSAPLSGERLSDYDYTLPPESIAQSPAERREHSRLLVFPAPPAALSHARFDTLPELLREGDLLVVNDTRVLPARLRAHKLSGGAVELLLVRPEGETAWRCMARANRPLRADTALEVAGPQPHSVRVVERLDEGFVRVDFGVPPEAVVALAEAAGEVPLPPYIDPETGGDPEFHRRRYQTVWADKPGAVAAPTAGLHFTPALLAELEARGVRQAHVTLHVGPDTFLPVRSEALADHRLQGETYEVPAATAQAIAETRAAGGRIVAVGTTTTRALESTGGRAGAGLAELFIRPGYRFAAIDFLVTNFHLPRSTLLCLVSAAAGRERVLAAYQAAIDAGYRFYSYGDAMLIELLADAKAAR